MARAPAFLSRPDLAVGEPVLDPWEGLWGTVRERREQRGQQAAETARARMQFLPWATLVPEARGPLDLDMFAWQRELYGERAAHDREQVLCKATQVGVSTWAIRWAMFHADVLQRTVLYTFPTDDELGEFSKHRIRPVIRASEHLRQRMSGDGVNNVSQKQIGANGWLYFRGTMKPIDSIPADAIVFDEYDTSDQENIEASERRVTGPQSAGLIRRVGVPSIPGYGISQLFDDSDQRIWQVKCDACGQWNPMRGYEAFKANVDQDALVLVCGPCRRPLDVRQGEWVATYPDREVRGYHVPKLLIPGRQTLRTVVANSRKTRDDQREAFHTRDLGEAYSPKEGRLSREQILACVRPELRPVEHMPSFGTGMITMGIDVASARAFNVTIEEALDDYTGRKLWIGEVDDEPGGRTAFQMLCFLMNAYSVHMACIDNGPEGRFARAFCDEFPGRAYRVGFFTPQPGRKDPPAWDVDDRERFVSLWRTKAYDATFERYRMQRVLLPPLDMLPPDFPDHLGNLHRRKVEMQARDPEGKRRPTGQVRVEYVKTGPEDFAQAEAYNLCAIELFHRNSGLDALVGAGPRSLVDEADFVRADLSSLGDDPGVYRPGLE